jgi:hypothetical protein
MSFADTETKRYTPNPDFKRTEFMQLQAGGHRIRILEPKAKKVLTHYINKYTVLCLGDECPICANNKKIIMQFPDTWKDQNGYYRATKRYLVNVFDKTYAKVCTACGKEYKNTSTVVCTCGEGLSDAHALNKVKVLAKGVSLFEQLVAIDNAILDDSGEKVGITNYDINIVVSGSGRDVSYTPIPDTSKREPVEFKAEDLFDLDKASIKLNPEELLDLSRGVTLKDIFAARKSQEVEVQVNEQVSEETLANVNQQVANLFNQ